MSRSLSAFGLALAVASGLAFFPSAAQAQKGLVYCPAPIDATGCAPVVTALSADPSPFPDGVETAYDGSSGTVDLATADLSGYAVLVVPSLADGAGAEPYGLLRNQQIVGRLSPAFNGRNAVWSGTPDHGSTNRAAKDALLRNLAGWAKGGGATGRGPGIVMLQDNSDDAGARYSWLRGISGLTVVADTTFEVYSNVQVLTSTGRQLLTNSSGLQIGYTNMAAYGLIASGTGASNDATGGRATRVVLVTTAGEASDPTLATVQTDKEDYAPGDTITVTGAGWEPGETVSLLFHEDVDPPIHPDKTLTAVADADGHISNHQYEVEETDLGVRFTLVATGQTSGRTAQTTFTDASREYTAIVNPTSQTGCVSSSLTFTITNTGGSPQTDQLGSANITIPSSYTGVSVGTPTVVPATKTWTANIVAGIIQLRATADANRLNPPSPPASNQSVSVSVTATPPLASASPIIWATATRSAINFTSNQFNLVGTDPAVSVTTGTNTAPSFTKGPNQTVLEDAGSQSVANWATAISAGPACESAQTVAFNVTNDNNTLFSAQPAITSSGTLTYTPAANANGSATVSVALQDNGGTANGGQNTSATQTFTINVTSVNDVPTFAAIANQTVNAGAPQQTVTVTGISAGPANENSQLLIFTVTNNNAGAFATAPAIGTISGTTASLTYTPAANVVSTTAVTVTVVLQDDGGTANSGVDKLTRTFTITVNPRINADPVANNDNYEVLEDHTLTVAAPGVLTNDTDADGDPLTASQQGNAGSGTGTIASDGGFTYTPNANFFGSDKVNYKANDGQANSNTAMAFVTVVSVNDAPSFTKGANQSVTEGSALHTVSPWATAISAGPANESGQTLTFNVTANSNAALFAVQPAVSSTGVLTYTLAASGVGVATITLELKDNGGTTNGGLDTSPSQSFTITVNGVPDLTIDKSHTSDFTEGVNGTYSLVVSNGGTGPTNGTVTVTDALPTGLGFVSASGGATWTCGFAAGTVTCARTAAIADGSSAPAITLDVSVAAAAVPSKTNTASVSGGGEPSGRAGNNSDNDPTTVNPSNRPPVLATIGDKAVDELVLLSFTATATDPDLPAQTLTFSLDAGFPTGASITTAGAFSWTPTEAQGPGVYPVTIRVSDGALEDFETISITVNEVNLAPTITGVPATKTIDELSLYSFDADATDDDVPPQGLSFSLVGEPSGATINGSTGVFSWTPSEAQGPGSYSFSVRVSDGVTHTDAPITITVNEVNISPTISGVPSTATVDELVNYTFTATATDPDMPPQGLTFSLVGEPSGATINSSTGAFSWTPGEDQGPSTYTFTVRVSDGTDHDDAEIKITVNEVNVAPTLTGVPATATVDELVAYTFDAHANDPDIPPQGLTFSLVGEPSGATINSSTGAFSWTPTEAQGPGSYTFTVRVSDGTDHDEASITVTVNEVNLAPQITGVPATKTIDELVAYSFDADATDDDIPVQTLTFSLDGEPSGATINGSTGVFHWTPTEAQGPGVYAFSVRVSDGVTHTDAPISITVNEVNVAPTLTGVPATATVDELVAYTFDADANDTDLPAQTLTFSLVGGPLGATINSSTGVFDWTPSEAQGPGVYPFTVRVSDGMDHTDAPISITVKEVNVAPELATITDQSVVWGSLLSFTATATDADLPPNTLAFSLVGTPPTGAAITAGGAFTWTPTGVQVGPHSITVRVTDNGSPAMHDEQTFTVTVNKHVTALVYTGATSGLYGGAIGVSAMLTDQSIDLPISGKVVSFTLSTLGVSATTQSGGAAGLASASLTLAKNVGAYTVASAFAEDALYLGSADSKPFSINPAPLTIKADNKTMFFGAAAPPAFTATYTGFVLGQGTSALSGTLGFSGTATTANSSTPVGSYTITPGGQTSTNYNIGFQDGTLALIYNNLVGHQFLQPVNIPPLQRSAFKIGSTIPVKFQLFRADGVTPVTNAVATIQLNKLTSGAPDGVNEDVYTNVPDQGFSFRYNGGQYIFNLGTKQVQLTNGTYRLTALLNDGTTIIQDIEMKAN